MRISVYILLLSLFFINEQVSTQEEYYDFPFDGWNQTLTSSTWNGIQFVEGISTYEHQGDTLIDGQIYQLVGNFLYRYEDGVMYQNKYNGHADKYEERIMFDFSLEVGDTFTNFNYSVEDSVRVIRKEKKTNLLGDSVWHLDLEYQKTWSNKDTLHWIEGVGDKQRGLFFFVLPDGGIQHSCTHLDDFRKIYVNEENTSYCTCRFLNGVDQDNDGYGNDISRTRTIYLGKIDIIDHPATYFKAKACDTLRIVRDENSLSMLVHTGPNCTGMHMEPDSLVNEVYKGKNVLTSYYYEGLSGVENLYVTHQCSEEKARIELDTCTKDDCNDNNPAVHPGQTEQPYNGLDDDCDSTTLDDDLDMDGYDHEEDCNDQDSTIHPGAVDIPDNGIDEDCDGMDSTTTTEVHRIGESAVNIYPNPSSSLLNISIAKEMEYSVSLYSLTGKEVLYRQNVETMDLNHLEGGVYILQVQSLKSGQQLVRRIVVE